MGVAATLHAVGALATNGYYGAGYGIKSNGVAGAGIAFPQDALAIATNPAGLVAVRDGLDVGLEVFTPTRGATLVQGGQAQYFDGNDTPRFWIPSIGYARHLSPALAVGVALFGNGGLQTDYASSPFARFGATGPAGVGLEQALLSPALAWRFAPKQSLGFALNFGYQRFEAKGLALFSAFSSAPQGVSDRGKDSATGVGIRIGWQAELSDAVTVGATWQSKTSFGRFDKYAGLFADRGGFDAPSTYGIGLAFRPAAALTLAADWQHIRYSEVNSVGNSVASLFAGVPLGEANGPGFGWRDVSVVKLGSAWDVSERWTVRAGVSRNRQPLPRRGTFFNILAPGVVETHLTAGASWRPTVSDEVNVALLHAPRRTVNGSGSIPLAFGGGEANVRLSETSIGLGWSHRF